MNRYRRDGFTLIELMLVVIIIGALVAMVMPRLAGRGEQARVSTATADVRANIATGLKMYELDNGSYPSTSEGLNALLSQPGSASSWNGPYLEKKPIDPWGREYQYKCPGDHRSADYDLYSLGRDGVESVDDVKTGNKAFTLIEVMVASAILVFGVVLVYEALFKSLDAFNYYANYLKVFNWMDEKIWQVQDELTGSGVFSEDTSGEYLNNNRKVIWDLSYGVAGDGGLFRIDLRLALRTGKKDMVLTRSAYALFVKKEE